MWKDSIYLFSIVPIGIDLHNFIVSDSETIIDCPQRLGDVVSIQVLL